MKITEIARFVDDVPAAVEFYQAVLGIRPSYADGSIATFQHAGWTLLIHERYLAKPGDLPCEDHVAFGVDSVDGTVAGLAAQGLVIEFPPRDYDWGRSAYLRDPAGSLIEITSISDPAKD